MFAVAGLNLRVTDDAIRRLAIAAIAITIVTPLAYGVAVVVDPRKSAPTRVNWPQAEISRRMVEIWERETKAPLRIVAGYFWVPDIITLTAPPKPSVLTGRSLADSPWITPTRLAREGALLVWDGSPNNPPRILASLVQGREIRQERFTAERLPKGREIVINYAILRPAPID
ncbi:MAG: hypothetical protein ABS54_17190 [Hyphomicrobium sp. SCN 65-11]|nr:MAG: hypothetical protein ABS54_17190 [Hyphomicrobium sp. SCN 65-11]